MFWLMALHSYIVRPNEDSRRSGLFDLSKLQVSLIQVPSTFYKSDFLRDEDVLP